MTDIGTRSESNDSGADRDDIDVGTSTGKGATGLRTFPLPWLLRAKVTVPARGARYLDRPGLIERALPTHHRLVLVRAPGGFGKTTLLAECCRHLLAQGVITAWLSVDEQDSAEVLDAYLLFAFHHAGLDAAAALDSEDTPAASFVHRVGLLACAIEAHGRPCVLVLDELERLTDPESVELINYLLERIPENCHVALSCRQLPEGIDLAAPVLVGASSVLTPAQLRFSKAEIARYIGGSLSRRQLASLISESDGWPIALQIYSNQRDSGSPETMDTVTEVVDHWITTRLWRGLSVTDRDLLLDLGLFDWMDGDVVDAVFDIAGSLDHIRSLPILAGLVKPLRPSGSEVWRLHPLIANYCASRRRRETPERFRSVHRRIAKALSKRGDMVSAMRHASQAGDAAMVGDIMAQAGGVRLLVHEGLALLQSADRYLTREVFRERPYLALARCIVLLLTGRLQEARQLYAATEARTRGFQSDPTGTGVDIQVARVYVEGQLYMYGGESVRSAQLQTLYRDAMQLADNQAIDPLIRGSIEHGLCFLHNQRAEFDAAADRAERALQCVRDDSPYVTQFVDLQLGLQAMAQGRLEDAQTCYARARRTAKSLFLRDPQLLATSDMLMKELELERNLLGRSREMPVRIPKALMRSGTPFNAFAAASGVVMELTLASSGADSALSALDVMLEFTRRHALPSLARIVSAHRVALLAQVDRLDEAKRRWRFDGMPDDEDGCLTLSEQSWRELEAVSCARLRLLTVEDEHQAGRRFLNRLTALCEERGLRRTWMRALALGLEL